MRIQRAWIEAYSQSLNEASGRGADVLSEALENVGWDMGVELVRDQLIGVMETCCGATTEVTARLAADFYDGLRERCGVPRDGFEAVIDPCRDPKATEGAVRAFVQDLVDERPAESVASKCLDRLDREARLAANLCVERNARRDPRKPTWARIPTGEETCDFCIMLASRGFVYHSGDLAAHAHADCNCRVVPSWDASPEVEGYDPDALYELYRLNLEKKKAREEAQ